MIQKILTKLIYLLIIIYPTGLLLRVNVFSNAYFVPQDLIIFIIAILTISHYAINKKFKFSKFYIYQLLFLSVGVISLIFNSIFHPDIKFFQSLLYALRYLAYLTLIIVPLEKKSISYIKFGIYFAGSAILVIGYWQFFFYYDLFKLFYLGWDNHLYRMFSSFLDPNYAGVFFTIFTLLLFDKIIKGKFIDVYKAIIITFFSLLGVYLTFSRTALLSLVAGIVCYAIYFKKIKVLTMSLLVMGIFLLIISDTHVEGLNPLRTASTNSRINSVKESISIYRTSPILGIGFNSYRYAQVRLGFRNAKGASWSNADAGTDNSFLFILVTTGIVGFIMYILSIYYLVKRFAVGNNPNLLIGSIMCVLLVGSMFINLLFYTPIITIWFLIIRIYSKD